ncbi:hypothetical protein ACFE04_017989 [Oxalis oulophora]
MLVHSNKVLSNLSKSGRVDEARKLFDEMPQRDVFTWNTMLAAYANSGKLNEAKIVFNQTPFKDVIAWNSLISGFCRYGYDNEALDFFKQMQFQDRIPNEYTLGSVLKLSNFQRRGEQIHAYAIKIGFGSNDFVVTGLVDMYAKGNCIFEAEYLFETMMDSKNHVMWTAMITGYSQNGDLIKAMECFREMKVKGVESNHFTFPSILTACAAGSAIGFGKQVHICIIKSGFEANIYVQSALVDMYVKCGDFNSARFILEITEIDNAVSWNSMIVGYSRQGQENEALSLFKQMHTRGMLIDDFTYPSVLNCFARTVDIVNAKSVHCLTIKTGFEAYKLVSNALVDMYAKQGNLDIAFEVFKQMPDKDVISWTSLVTGYAHNDKSEESLKLFCEMRNSGICSDQIVYSSVLKASAELTVLEFGQQVHAIFIESGLKSSLSVDNSLLTMYMQCGCLEDANKVFNSMQVRDVITWTAVIVGYAKNGKGKDSVKFYDKMLFTGIKPDFITFIGLLFACSHAGLLEEGREYFETMDKKFGIKPCPDHYACMIDLLGRSGKLDEAKKLLDEMVVEPDGTVWKALLAACRVHGNLELAERAAKKLFELEPMDAVPHVMLSNMYSAAGRWEDAAKIRRIMKLKGISKEPGCSWIEVSGTVNTFRSDDRGHPRTVEIYSKIVEIMRLIKKAGYMPDMNFALHDTDEEGKELGLAYHSEKLAVAFGLLTLPEGAPIRVYKNLRVCGDCHSAMKFISKVYLRQVILRDSNCFHHFQEGICSCGDYW